MDNIPIKHNNPTITRIARFKFEKEFKKLFILLEIGGCIDG